MVRHVVMFRWKPGTSPDTIKAIEDGLAALPAQIPQLRDYRFGRDAGLSSGNFDFAVVADVGSAEDYALYRDHPAHRAVADGFIRPNAAERAAVQYFVD